MQLAAVEHATKPSRKGKQDGKFYMRSIRFDWDTREEIKKLAAKNNVSFAEQVRTFVVWGIETENEG